MSNKELQIVKTLRERKDLYDRAVKSAIYNLPMEGDLPDGNSDMWKAHIDEINFILNLFDVSTLPLNVKVVNYIEGIEANANVGDILHVVEDGDAVLLLNENGKLVCTYFSDLGQTNCINLYD